MVSNKFLKFCLIVITIANIIFFISVLLLREVNHCFYCTMGDKIYHIMREFDIIIYVYNILIFPKVDFGIFYKAALTFYIIVNILFLNMLKNNRYNRLIYFLYIMINISLTIFGYSEIFTIIMYVFETGNYSDILDIFIGNNFFTHIIFFLEVLFPISYFRVNNPMLKK